jgi:CheY-like chemotaxis protein
VLVLDHDVDGRELLRTVLQQRGAVVQTVASISEALESLEALRPEVQGREADSPEKASYALFGRIRTLDADRGGRIPALTLTTFDPIDGRLGQQIAQVQRDVPKPIEPVALTAEVARLAGRERRHAQR